MTSVVSVKKAELNKRGIKDFEAWNALPNTLYIGRNMSIYVKGAYGSKWCNIFHVKDFGLEQCLIKYEEYVRNTPSLYNNLEELQGKELGCWCKTEKTKNLVNCHGDILIKLLEEKQSKVIH